MSAVYQRRGPALRVVSSENEIDGLREERQSPERVVHALTGETELCDAQRLRRVQLVTDAALAHLRLDDLLAALLDRTKALLEVDTAAILLLDVERRELVARAAVGIEEEVEQGVRIPLGAGFAGRIAAERQPLFLPDIDHADVLNPLLREKGIKSLLGVPLLVHGDVLGVLHVGTLAPRDFTPDETKLLQMVAERAALAIEKARLHRELVEVDELRANFVAFASHELRTPATSVFGVLATLHGRGDELPEEQRRQLVEGGYEEGARLTRLLEQLLDLSRLDATAIALKPRPLVLRSLLAETLSNSTVDPNTVRLEVRGDLAIVADPLVLDRVISQLLVNAARHGSPPVVVAAEQRDGQLRISVEDAGPGIPDELRPRIFERFGRGDDVQGSGLGLTIARAYAQAHDGDLVYQPQARGTRFELILPRSRRLGPRPSVGDFGREACRVTKSG